MDAATRETALRVGPDDVLIIHLGDEWEPEVIDAFEASLHEMGIGDRTLLVYGTMKMAVVERLDAKV